MLGQPIIGKQHDLDLTCGGRWVVQQWGEGGLEILKPQLKARFQEGLIVVSDRHTSVLGLLRVD